MTSPAANPATEYTITSGPYLATVDATGAGLRLLRHDGRDLVLDYPAGARPPQCRGQLLAPWPNRVDRGRYTFGGAEHRLVVNEPERDNAIHGLSRWAVWTPVEVTDRHLRLGHRLSGETGYPFDLDLSVCYELDASGGLTVRLTAMNCGSAPAPYGSGAHPYLTLGRPITECRLTVTAASWQPVDERLIPREPPRPVEGTRYDFRSPAPVTGELIDNAYTDLERDAEGRAWVLLSDAEDEVGLWMDDTQPWLQIFTGVDPGPDGARTGVAAEPMSCPPNALATGRQLIVLDPGQEVTHTWGITRRR
ncbi:aldose 1-epimerase family protein [Allonocardiopsis opalescens]|uniref:Aldose 1-epimerase n=1 Tax=Allonocardiopsis opalescens TaxID=1144618 RepID=A0A2T0Q3Y0_9ACTN|nr:aldose 1-epimerase family protein [Allonocardiopsis opalescens]PRX98453.1 aldose 1-epimerase [Allonocardiopsis opalescens]